MARVLWIRLRRKQRAVLPWSGTAGDMLTFSCKPLRDLRAWDLFFMPVSLPIPHSR